ncbi:DUF6922 domain-containing protein [Flavobacterium sp. RSB2_4_14]|uniref:DUF6922 domain-containing protein n=1 Tax=Flavobacterium sp. RSB2_4_14 TaxID=3447665 RepID=UPI003F35DF9E
MNLEITINDFSKHLFWDVDLNDFDFEKHAGFFAQRVIEYGKLEDWNLLKKLYGLEKIKKLALEFRTLDAVSLSYIATIFNIKKEEFRCYKHKQLVQNYWNS